MGTVSRRVADEQLHPLSWTGNQTVQLHGHLPQGVRLPSVPAVAALSGLPAAAYIGVPAGEEPSEEGRTGSCVVHAVPL